MAKRVTAEVEIRAVDSATRTLKKTESSFKGLGTFLAGAFTAAVAIAVGAMVKFLRALDDATKAAGEQEDAVEGLRSQLSALGPATDSVTASLAAQAAELQKVTTFGDEVTLQAQTQLAVFTQDTEAIKRLTVVTQDFATAQRIGLVEAAKLVAKTFGSSTNALSRYGIEVEGTAGSSEKLDSLVSGLSDLFGGRATDAVNTYQGALKQLANAQGDTTEAFGELITQNEEVLRIIKLRTTSAQQLTQVINGQKESSSALAVSLENVKLAYDDAKLGAALWADAILNGNTVQVQALANLDAMNEGLNFQSKSLEDVSKEMDAWAASIDAVDQAEFEREILAVAAAMDVQAASAAFDAESIRLLEEAEESAREEKRKGIEALETQETATEDLTESRDADTESTIRNTEALFAQEQQLLRTAQAVVLTRSEFDRLAASQGRAGAVEAALAAGGRLVQSGRVVELAGGGSILVNSPFSRLPS